MKKIPLDISALLKAAADIEAAASTPVSVGVYVDELALGELAASVRSAFASASAQVRVTVAYYGAEPVSVHEADDIAVLVAGLSEHTGAQAAHLRAAGVPTMVVAADPQLVSAVAAEQGNPIPQGDVVPLEGMGEWVIAVCKAKKLAFALAFPFARRPLAMDAVQSTSVQNAGIGAVLFIPGADMPVMTLNQAKMLLQIAAAYGQPLGMERVKELGAVVGGAFACRAVARQVAGVVPGLGWAVKAAIGYTGTMAMGRAAIDYFEAGGNASGLANVVRKAREGAVSAAEAAAETPAGRKAAQVAQKAVAAARDVALKR